MGGRSRCIVQYISWILYPSSWNDVLQYSHAWRYSHKRTCRDSRVCRNSRFHNNCGFVDFKINQLLGKCEKITQYFWVFLVCTDYWKIPLMKSIINRNALIIVNRLFSIFRWHVEINNHTVFDRMIISKTRSKFYYI